MRYEDDHGGNGEEGFQFRTDWRVHRKVYISTVRLCLSGFLEFLSNSTLEQEARRVTGHSRRIWIKGKGQPNVEEDLRLKLAFIHSLHLLDFSSLEASPPAEFSTPVPRSTSTRLTKCDPRDQRRRALRRDPLFHCRLSASHSRRY